MTISLLPDSSSLGTRILLQMALRVAIVIVIASSLGYYFVYRSVEQSTLENLKKYVHERGERESQPFLYLQSNLRTIADDFLEEIAKPVPANTEQEFKRLFMHNPDGAWRRRPEGHDIRNQASSFISSLTPLTPDLKRRALSASRLTTAYGKAWQNNIIENIYIASLDGMGATYWPSFDWAKKEKPAHDFSKSQSASNANQLNNPSRSHVWTPIYYDPVAKAWMATCILPIDAGGGFRHYAGADISLEDILKRTASSQIEGTYNLIFRADGRLISHPLYVDKIKQSEGEYNLNGSSDPHLHALFQTVTHSGESGVAKLEQFDEYLGVALIKGPGWYFVTVFPKALIAATARKAAESLLWLGFFSLTLELLILLFIIRKQIAAPLRQLAASAARIREGDLSARCEIARRDELGDLATSFNTMGDSIKANSAALQASNLALESRVAERTKELTKSMSLLQTTLESTHDAILVVDMSNSWVLHNQRFIDLWNIPEEIAASGDDGSAVSYVLDQVEDAEGFVNKVSELYATPEANSFDVIKFTDGKIVERYSRPQFMDGNVVGRVWSFRDITEQHGREAELAANRERLHEIEQRQMLSQERQRLMQDMHDGLGSSLTSALRVVEHGCIDKAEVAQVLKGCIDDLKLAIDSMEPVDADLLLLLATLRFRLGPRLESTGITLRWEVENVPPLDWLDPKNSLHILRILQEAFTNIIKHTLATGIRVATKAEDDYVVVTVTDNGQGFAVESALKSGGKGLANQMRRAESIGAEIKLDSNGAGTCFTLRLPIKRQQA